MKFHKKQMGSSSNGIRRSLNGLCSITEVKQRRALYIIVWVTACDVYTRGAQRTT